MARGDERWWPQSLAKGAAGVALLHIELAHAGLAGWHTAHAALTAATQHELTIGANAGLYFGAPAVGYAMRAAASGRPDRYQRALAVVDAGVGALARRRLQEAHARLDRAEPARLAEWDLIYGLTGLGAYLLGADPDLARKVLAYLVRLTEPTGSDVPAWWTDTDPAGRVSARFPGGHANLGMAHGLAGPLALLSIAHLHGNTVDGQVDAIVRMCGWLDACRQDGEAGPWWPQWITLPELRRARLAHRGPSRPSWCYGTPGLARAQQLAGIAVRDPARQRLAKEALLGCLRDPRQLRLLTDGGLCHGWAGLYQSAWRTADDAGDATLAAAVAGLAEHLTDAARLSSQADPGLLDGAAGIGLARHTADRHQAPRSGWDRCLLLA